MMWRSPWCPSLTPDERRRVREIQEWLRAVKECPTCKEMMPIDFFGDRDSECAPCFERRVFERGHNGAVVRQAMRSGHYQRQAAAYA